MDLYQVANNDGPPRSWSAGREHFDRFWDHASDLLRFHRGAGFTIRQHGRDAGPAHPFRELHDRVLNHLTRAGLDTVFDVTSVADGYSVVCRRHEIALSKTELILAEAESLKGTPYAYGVPPFTDCSWFSSTSYEAADIALPRTSLEQRLDPQVLAITRAQIKTMDLLFYDGHVGLYLDDQFGGRIWDNEPHDTTAPWGGMQGVGVQIRSMAPGWYCQWAHVLKIGRVLAVNGPA